MATNPNMEAIETITVGATSVASIDFTNIPQGYTDLIVYISARSSLNTQAGVKIQFNSNSSAVYDIRNITGNGSTPNSGNATNQTFGYDVSLTNPANYTANTFSNGYIYIPNYTSSNNKSFSVDTVVENNATLADCALEAGIWRNTAAITSVNLSDLGGGNFVQYSSATLYGITNAAVGAKATGGIISETDTHWYHTFSSSGTFTPNQALTAEILTIAGGGSGGLQYAGGGGAGGLVYTSSASLGNGTVYTCTVGAGAAKAVDSNPRNGTAGSNSTITGSGFSTITANGGGYGGGDFASNPNAGGPGGSGGGGTAVNSAAGGTGSQGFNGGAGGGVNTYGGGGGGAGEAGNTDGNGYGGDGSSAYSSWGSDTSTGENIGGTYFYAGGAGGSQNISTPIPGGSGGGGTGGYISGGNQGGGNGKANTGGGGGAGWGNSNDGGAGGSGIVIIRYAK